MHDKRQYPSFSHFSFSRSQFSRKMFSVLTGLQKEKDQKNLAYFVFSYAPFFKRGEFYFTLILSGKGLTREFNHLLFSHGYYFNLPYLLVFMTASSQ